LIDKCGRQNYIDGCTRKEKTGIRWLKAVTLKYCKVRRGSDRGRCPLCLAERNVKCTKIKKWVKELICSNGEYEQECSLWKIPI
jgi:hypothetical protein